MFSWFDVVILLIVLAFAFFGYKDGFAKSLLSFVQVIACIALSYIFYDDLAEFLKANTNLYNALKGLIQNGLSETPAPGLVASPIADAVFSALCFIAVYIVVWIIFKLVIILSKRLNEVPIFKQVNRAFGFIFGAVKGVVFSAVVCSLLWVLGTFGIDSLSKIFNASALAKILYLGNWLKL